jgi:polar amino acid transport system ATP-binding protein
VPHAADTQSPLLSMEAVDKWYGAFHALKNINLTVRKGEKIVLCGPSGSGKSTLIRCINALEKIEKGTIMVEGTKLDASGKSIDAVRREVGMVFQSFNLFPHMTILENCTLAPMRVRGTGKAEVEKIARKYLERVRILDQADKFPAQLSGGQQQRVALARTIAIEPMVLLLDEPLSNLDAKLRVHMRAELLALQRKLGITTIFVTHDQEEALSISDRVAVLDRGVIQQIGTPMELYDHPANRFIADFVGTINLLSGSISKDGSGLCFHCPTLGRIPLLSANAGEGNAEVAIRPHALTLSERAQNGDRMWLDGLVTEREFLGEFVRYTVKVGDADLIADQPHFIGSASYARGARLKIGIDPAQIRLLKR